jgi:hypothetical protein
LLDDLLIDLVGWRERGNWRDARRAFVKAPEQVALQSLARVDHARRLFHRSAQPRVITRRLLECLNIEAVVRDRLAVVGNCAGDNPRHFHFGGQFWLLDLFADCVHWHTLSNG